jgi:di/tripeptidase
VADDTTLGADNGIGVALILAALEDATLAHGPLEALLTVDEEAGMGGAHGLAARHPAAGPPDAQPRYRGLGRVLPGLRRRRWT